MTEFFGCIRVHWPKLLEASITVLAQASGSTHLCGCLEQHMHSQCMPVTVCMEGLHFLCSINVCLFIMGRNVLLFKFINLCLPMCFIWCCVLHYICFGCAYVLLIVTVLCSSFIVDAFAL